MRLAWFGNDWVTLVVALPLLVTALFVSRGGSVRALLIWFGVLAYGVYNYAFYMFGAALNAFFPIYLTAFLSALIALILGLSNLRHSEVEASFRELTPVHLLGGYLVFVGLGLSAVWIIMWGRFVFAGSPLPVEEEAFRLVAALDLTVVAPALTIGGVLLWMRRAWGYVIAPVAAVQGFIYLLVLTVNSALFIGRGIATPPGELPVWGPLMIATVVATVALLVYAGGTGVSEPAA